MSIFFDYIWFNGDYICNRLDVMVKKMLSFRALDFLVRFKRLRIDLDNLLNNMDYFLVLQLF